MDNQQIVGNMHKFSSSYIELQNFYSKSLDPMLEMNRERTPSRRMASDNLSDLGTNPSCPQMLRTNGLLFPQFSTLKDAYLPHKNYDNSESKDTLQSLVQSCSCGNEPIVPQPSKSSQYSLLHFAKHIGAENHLCNKHEKQQTLTAFTNVEKERVKNKTRIRWTEDLHDKFITSVNHLGGPKKATPKGILKLMNCDGLTIFHIKSHLQKCRVARVVPKATEESVEQLDSKTGVQIVEALRLHMDVQRRLYEQLESQKKLQMRIEEQAKQLQIMIESQSKTK